MGTVALFCCDFQPDTEAAQLMVRNGGPENSLPGLSSESTPGLYNFVKVT